MTLESAGATGSGPGIKQVTAPISPQDTATLKVDVKPGQLLGPRRRRRHPRRAPEGRARARERAERPVATVDPRPALLTPSAHAGTGSRGAAVRRPPVRGPRHRAGAPRRRARRSSSATCCSRTPTRPAASSACCARTPASSRPRRVFADLTGDGKSDAVVTVENGGAAGAVAAYVLTAEGSDSGALRVAFRNQSLYQRPRAHERPHGDGRRSRSTLAATTSAARATPPSATTRGTRAAKTFTRRATRTVTTGPAAARSRSRG